MNISSMEKYLKPIHVENGDEVKIIDEGAIVEKTFNGEKKQAFEITIELPSGDTKTATLNKISRNILSDAWSSDTKLWMGKRALITKNKQMVGSQMRDVLIFQAVAEEKLPF